MLHSGGAGSLAVLHSAAQTVSAYGQANQLRELAAL
jgi:hypothetical protein